MFLFPAREAPCFGKGTLYLGFYYAALLSSAISKAYKSEFILLPPAAFFRMGLTVLEGEFFLSREPKSAFSNN